MTDTIFTNARLVLPDAVLDGTLLLRNGEIAEIQPRRSPNGTDFDGDYLIPGIVDVHTDNLERQVQPRALARWPSRSALLTHDAQCAAAGVTSVFDALCLGDLGFDESRMATFRNGVADLEAMVPSGMLKSDHFLHLRCELPAADMMPMLDSVADHPLVAMVSLMDHSPGVGQYSDLDRYRAMRVKGGLNPAYVENRIAELVAQRGTWRNANRRALLARLAHRHLPLASHDDRTEEEIAENCADGIRISEFPVSMIAAQAATAKGMDVIAGAPNIVRGGSHSGNVSAADLVRAGTIDAFASDYVPASLVEAAFLCAADHAITLPQAIALITDRPARMVHLHDRGRIETGLRADLVRVRLHDGHPVIRAVWRQGERVA